MKTRLLIILGLIIAVTFGILLVNYVTSNNFDKETWYEKRSLIMSSHGLHNLNSTEREDFITKYTDTVHNGEFHSQVYITDLQNEYAIGEPITFTVVTWGYNHPCQSPSFVYYYETKDSANIVFEDKFVRLCQVLEESDYTYYYQELGSNQTHKAQNQNIYPVFYKPGNYVISVDDRTQKEFSVNAVSDDVKQEVLTQLRQGPQNVNGTAKQFLVSEALADQRVWDLLKDTTYQVNCCTYALDGNEYPYPLYIGITFQLNEKDMYVTAEYDLQQEKITGVEIKEGIRTGGVVSFEPKEHVEISVDKFKHAQSVGHPIDDFTIKIEGYYPKPHAPDIQLVNETGHVIWTNYDDIGHVILGRIGPVEFCNEYQFYDIGDPITFNNTGTYKFIFTFEEFSLDMEIVVRQNVSGGTLDNPNFHCD